MSRELLVFQHVPNEHPGLLKDAATAQGVTLNVLELWKPYVMPEVGQHAGLIIMGGPMGVNDNYSSKKDEVDYTKKGLSQKLPMIGFCLGSQLLAHTLGSEVYPNMKSGQRVKEIGYYDVDLTEQGKIDPIFKGFTSPVKVLQWHGDAFDLPHETTLLATSPNCENQAFRFGKNVYGMLFHNEFTPEMIAQQIEDDKSWIHTDFELDENELLAQAQQLAPQMRQQCNQLFNNFLRLIP